MAERKRELAPDIRARRLRPVAALVGLGLVLGLSPAFGLTPVAGAPTTSQTSAAPSVVRLAGPGWTDTAIKISQQTAPGSTQYAVLATGNNFPDALAGGPLAAALHAPILLTRNAASGLEPAVVSELARLRVTNVIILGGTCVVRASIEAQLAKSYRVERLGGKTLYDTAILIADRLKLARGNSATSTTFLADGKGYPDALSISPVAAALGMPIVFTPRTSGTLNAATKAYLAKEKPGAVYVIGGTSAVRQSARDQAASAASAKTVVRVAGATLYGTNVAVLNQWKSLFPAGGTVTVATGRNFPDALAGAAFAAKKRAPLFLVDGTAAVADPAVRAAAIGLKPATTYVFGGTSVVPDQIVQLTVSPTPPVVPQPQPQPPALPSIQPVSYVQAIPIRAPVGYTTLEGITTDGKYIYAAYRNSHSSADSVVLQKFDLKGNLVKANPVGSKVGHGNDIAYIPKTNQLFVVGLSNKYTIVDPDTLAVIGGGTLSSGFSSVCYNAATDQYLLGGALYDGNLRRVKTLYTTATIDNLLQARVNDPDIVGQGTYCDSKYVYVMRGPSAVGSSLGDHTRVAKLDWTGKPVASYEVALRAEPEGIFALNGSLHIAFNRGAYSGGDTRADFVIKLNVAA